MGRHRGLLPSYSQVLKRRTRRRLPRQLLRNLGLFYLVLAAGAGLLVLSSTRPDFFQEIGSRARIGFYWVRDKGTEVLPMAFNNLQLTTELSRSILAEACPMCRQRSCHKLPAVAGTLRSIVEAVTDYDLAEPERWLQGLSVPGYRWVPAVGLDHQQGIKVQFPARYRKVPDRVSGKAPPIPKGVVLLPLRICSIDRETLETWPSSGANPNSGRGSCGYL